MIGVRKDTVCLARACAALVLVGTLLDGAVAHALCGQPHGDLNASGDVDVVDVQCSVVSTLAVLNGSASENPPKCLAGAITTADVDCSGDTTVTDVLVVISLSLNDALNALLDANKNDCPDACELPPEGFCGDGILDPGESCDDGNTAADGNGCTADCQCENGYYGEGCSIAPPPGPYHK